MTTKKFLTAEEIVEYYGVDESVLQNLVTQGSLKALPDRGTFKFRRDDIDSLIRTEMLHPTKELPTVGDEIAADMITFADDGPSSSAVDFIELDEEALAEQPTIITTGEGGLFPKLAEETSGDDSSSEVHVVLEPMESDSSDSDIRLALPAVGKLSDEISDSDVKTFAAPQSAGSGDTSDSDVKTISSYEIAAARTSGEGSDSDVKTISSFEMQAFDGDDAHALTDDNASVFDFNADSGIALESASGAGQTMEIEIEEDDGISLPLRSSEQTMEMKATSDSAFEIGADSALKFDGSSIKSGDSSMLLDDPSSSVIETDADSGISLDTGDSGISLDTGDSGISLDAGDSGISLAAGDSGISLDAGDSGISLSTGDSGISLEADSGLTLDPKSGKVKGFAKTEAMFDVPGDDDDLDFNLAATTVPKSNLSDDDLEATAAFQLQGDSGGMPTLAGLSDDEIPVKGKKPDPLGFSGAIAAGATIEGLEVVEDLDSMFPEEETSADAIFEADEVEELEASDESFAEFDEAPAEDDFDSETYEVPTVAAKEPKDRGWGAVATLSVMSASVLMGANAWILWEGIATMWTGAQPSGPASAIISSLAGLF